MHEAAVPLIEVARSLDPPSFAPLALDALLGPPLRLSLWAAAAAIALVLLELAVRTPARPAPPRRSISRRMDKGRAAAYPLTR
jgi:hypothetical protein